jgi:hypothetical protein
MRLRESLDGLVGAQPLRRSGLQALEHRGIRRVPIDLVQRRQATRRVFKDDALHLAAMQGDRIRDAHEADHRVMRHEATGMALLQREFEFALQQERGIVDLVAHLDVVLQRHLLDRFGIRLALRLECGERVGS